MTQPDCSPHTPRYLLIERALRQRVARAEVDEPLPSEAQLCEEFGVSRMTVRAAVQRLVDDHLVYRERGRGTFVAAAPVRCRAEILLSFSDDMRRRGRTPSSRVVHAETRNATASEASRLRLAPGGAVVAIERVRLADTVPVALDRVVLPGGLAEVLGEDLEDGSLHQTLTRLGRQPAGGRSSVTAVGATTDQARLLGVAAGAPLLLEQRLIQDAAGEPLELAESWHVGERYWLDLAFHVQSPDSVSDPKEEHHA